MHQASTWLRDNVPGEATTGSFNAGINAYYSERTVINLDGVVNRAALDAVKEGDLPGYIEEVNIERIADYAYAIYVTYRPFYGHQPPVRLLTVIDEEAVSWHGSPLHIYRLAEQTHLRPRMTLR